MATVLNRTLLRIPFNRQIWCQKKYSILSCYPCNALNVSLFERKSIIGYKTTFNTPTVYKGFMNYSDKKQDQPEDEPELKKLSLFQKFKRMYKDYWYVLVPVHIVTSTIWLGGFYYMVRSGIDVIHILESLNVSEKVINPLRDSSVGYVAVAYACFKIATPARYTVTLGGTTLSINYLKKWGYIKPVPSKERMKEIYQEKTKSVREGIKEKKENLMESLHDTKAGIKEKKDNIIQTVKKTAEKKNLSNDVNEKTKI